jgi:hypothetical protein
MQTVIETPSYLSAAKDAGMTASELRAAIETVSANPEAGDLMQGTGGCRKLRLAGRGKGKSGGYRLITFFAGTHAPVFLLTVFSKGERANLTDREKAGLAAIAKTLIASLGSRAVNSE